MPVRTLTYLILTAFLITLGSCNNGPPPRKPVKIAIVNPGQRFSPYIKSFKQRMSDLNYLDGINSVFLYDGPTSADLLRQRLFYLKAQDIDLLYTITSSATRIAHEIFKDTDVPIVFGPVFSPIDDGFTSSLTRPDKNMTGVMIRGGTAEAFALLHETMPSLKSISVPFPCNEPTSCPSLEDLREVAEKSGVSVIATQIKSEADLDDYLLHLPMETEVIWLPHSSFIMQHASKSYIALPQKIPVASATSQFNYRTLLSYGPDLEKIGKQVADLADNLLQGIPASQLPIEQCEYYLSVDLEVALQSGVTIPDNVIWQARSINSVINRDPVLPTSAQLPADHSVRNTSSREQ